MDSRDKASSQQHSPQADWRWKRQSLQGLRPRVSVHYRKEVFDDIRSTLTAVGGEETLQQFLDGCFGNLMHFIGGTASKALHELLSREISLPGAREDELWFRIGGTNIRFAPPEYALVTGLCFGSSSFDPVESHKLPPDGVYRRFCSGRPISIGKLWERFKTQLVRGPADEYLKVAHVLALYLMGLGYELRTTVEHWVWVLVDDLEIWNKFPWGAYTYQALRHYVNMLPRKRADIGKWYQFYGPVWALQIWAYEVIPGLGCVNGKFTIPRCLNWSFPHKRHAHFFERKIVCSMTLEVTDEEKLQAYWLSVQTPQPLGVGYNVQRSSLRRVVQVEELVSVSSQQPSHDSDVIEISDTESALAPSPRSSGDEEHDSEPRAVEMESSEKTHTDTEMGGSSGEEESESEDDLNDSQVNEYKDLSYKFFQYQTYKLRGSNGELRCPFCAYYEEEGLCSYTRLLLHAIRVAEISISGKPKANHFAMARYLAIDLADELKAETEQLSWSKEGKRLDKGGDEAQIERKRPRLDEDCTKEELEKVRQLERELNEKTDQMNDLITKERLSNDELQGARRELIKGLNDVLKGNNVQIGIKNVGEIDSKVVIRELEKSFSPVFAVMKGVELCSLWQEKLKNPQWYPFQIIEDGKGKPQRLLKEDDELLQGLKKEWGQVIHNAVVVALNDLHKYNPGGCDVVPELWNYKQNRKAELDEVICYILEAVKDVVKMGNTLTIKNSRIAEHREIGSCLDKQRDINDSRISNSDEEFGIKESKIFELKEKVYKKLKSRTYKLRGSNGQIRCPFCSVVEEQEYTSSLQHALMMAESSSESTEQRANHFALAKFLVIDLPDDAEPSPQCTRSLPTSRKTLEMNTPVEYVQHEEYKKTKKEVPEKLLNEKKAVARDSR